MSSRGGLQLPEDATTWAVRQTNLRLFCRLDLLRGSCMDPSRRADFFGGGGSAKEWTRTLDRVLQLDFDTVVPGHGVVTTKQEMRNFRDKTDALRSLVQSMLAEGKTRDEISAMLQKEFHWIPFLLNYGLDGLLGELR
jgi:hypothetical protein